MAWLQKNSQLDEKSGVNVTALLPAIGEKAREAAPTPGTSVVATAGTSFIVPMFAIAVALAAVIAAGVNWDFWVAGRTVQSTDDAAVYADISAISARVSGTIDWVFVDDYARVKAGDRLFSIDSKPYEVALRASKARLEAAVAQLGDNDAQRAYQLTQIEVAVAQQEASGADEIQASKELERQKRLGVDGRASSIQNLEKATAARDRASANSKMARATIGAQRVKVDVLLKERGVLRANVDTAAADVAARELDRGYTSVRAPVDGVVAKRNVQLGNYVSAGSSLVAIVPLPHVYILANYKENQLSLVREGQPVDISVDLLPGKSLHGKVSDISPASGATFALLPPDNATGNFTKVAQRLTVRIEMDPDQESFDRLRPGMSVTTRINTKAVRRD